MCQTSYVPYSYYFRESPCSPFATIMIKISIRGASLEILKN